MRQDDDSDCTDADKSLHNLLSADPSPFPVLPHSTLSQTVTSVCRIAHHVKQHVFVFFLPLSAGANRIVTQQA